MTGESFEPQKAGTQLGAEVTELSSSGWADRLIGHLEIRILKACRAAANDNGASLHGYSVIRADQVGATSFFVIRCEDQLFRVIIRDGFAKLIRNDKMARIRLP